jgi:zinc protease
VGAAPHLPAGILSPYRDGERDAVITGFANHRRRKKDAEVAARPLLPVTIRGEGAGRRMRGSAGGKIKNCFNPE